MRQFSHIQNKANTTEDRIIGIWEKNNLSKHRSFSVLSPDEAENLEFSVQMAEELARRHLRRSLVINLNEPFSESTLLIDIISPPAEPDSRRIFLANIPPITEEIKANRTHYCGYIISANNVAKKPDSISSIKQSTVKILTIKKHKTKSSSIEKTLEMFDEINEIFYFFI